MAKPKRNFARELLSKLFKGGSPSEPQIPENLEECYGMLEVLISTDDFIAFKSQPESEVGAWHHDLGRYLRNNWGLWQDSVLANWFEDQGIHHADDMSGIIMLSFHRHLNGKPIRLREQIVSYREYWIKCGVDPDTMT